MMPRAGTRGISAPRVYFQSNLDFGTHEVDAFFDTTTIFADSNIADGLSTVYFSTATPSTSTGNEDNLYRCVVPSEYAHCKIEVQIPLTVVGTGTIRIYDGATLRATINVGITTQRVDVSVLCTAQQTLRVTGQADSGGSISAGGLSVLTTEKPNYTLGALPTW